MTENRLADIVLGALISSVLAAALLLAAVVTGNTAWAGGALIPLLTAVSLYIAVIRA